MAVVGQQLLQPENGWTRYHNSYPFFKREGGWAYSTQAGLYGGGSYYTTLNNSTFTFCFKGTAFRIIAPYYTNKSDALQVKIDNEVIETFSQKGSPIKFTYLVYEKNNLENIYHKVSISIIDNVSNNMNMQIEAIDLKTNDELVRDDYFENTHLPELTRKYGIAHFSFDEEAGSVYDKLGGPFVGTVTGATRVTGWNGEGKALNFNGVNQYLRINTSLFNSDINFSVQLKLKVTNPSRLTVNSREAILSTGKWGENGAGFQIYVADKVLCVVIRNGSATTSRSIAIDYVKENWVELLVSYEAQNKIIKVYIDEQQLIVAKIGDFKSNFNILMGANEENHSSTTYLHFFNGQIDDFKIYSKTLAPSDFPTKHVAFTDGHKVISLSPHTSRITELPNMSVETIQKHAYQIIDIDNAIDRPRNIDLTRNATEYEVVGGKIEERGKSTIFEIPIPNIAKKVFIENNE